MIDGSEERNRQLAFELQNSNVCEKHSKEKQKHKGVKKEALEKEGAVDELETTEAARFLKKLELHLYYMVKKVRF